MLSGCLTAGASAPDPCGVRPWLAPKPLLVCALLCALMSAGCPGEEASKPPRALDPIRAFAYEESSAGLKKLFQDMLGGIAERDKRYTRHLAKTLVLSAPSAWFKKHFGTRLGESLFEEYEPLTPDFASFADLMAQLHKNGQTRFVVDRFTDPKNDAATVYQALALTKMRKQIPLYSVRAIDRDNDRVFHVWSFVYQDGFFRWIGKTGAAAEGEPDPPEIGGDIDIREYAARDAAKIRKAAAEK